MKKRPTTNKKTDDAFNYEKFSKVLHDAYEEGEQLMEKYELESYIDDENQPIVDMLDDSDVTVEQVLLIGSVIALRMVHNELHKGNKKSRVGVIEIDGNLPPELAELLEKVLGIAVDNKKKGKK